MMKKKKLEKKVYITPVTKCYSDKDGIGRVIFLPNTKVTLNAAKKHIAACEKLANGKKAPVLIDIRNIKSVDHEARKYFAGEKASKITKASAVLVSSPISRILGDFFIVLNKPPFPIKLFTSKSKAMKWLRGFLKCQK